MSIDLIPPPMIDWFLDEVHPDLQECIANSHNEWKMAWLIDALRKGQYGLWVMSEGNEYKGCLVTEILATNSGTWLNVMFLANHGGVAWLRAALDKMEEEVRAQGWQGLKYVTSIPGFAGFAKWAGFKPRFIEYVKEVTA